MAHDLLSFFTAWMAAPGRVGAIAPSGAALAELITRDINANTGPVLELGPGTGAFTYQLLKRGVRQQDLTLIEYGSDFMRLLQLRSVEKRQRQQLLALQRKRAQTPVARNCRKRNASNLRRKRRTSHRPNRRNPHPTHWIRWGLQASFLRTWWYFCARL